MLVGTGKPSSATQNLLGSRKPTGQTPREISQKQALFNPASCRAETKRAKAEDTMFFSGYLTVGSVLQGAARAADPGEGNERICLGKQAASPSQSSVCPLGLSSCHPHIQH